MIVPVRGHDLSGTVLDGRYRLDERLAEGAMGVVYRGVSLAVDRGVAVKLMHHSLPGEMAARERFQREAKVMALVDHPHCVSVIDYGLHQGKPFLVMELVRGRSLHDLLQDQRRVEIERAVDIIRQVLSGLAYTHEQGIIHRDIKPANIMVTPKAPLGVHVRILDFGLARLLESSASLTDGLAVGTPSYLAPEQCRGDTPDARVDVYACGIVLFEMLTGRKPFVAKDPIEIVKLQLTARPPLLSDVAAGNFGKLEGVVARALAKPPDERYASAITMLEAIDAALAGTAAPEATAVLLGSSRSRAARYIGRRAERHLLECRRARGSSAERRSRRFGIAPHAAGVAHALRRGRRARRARGRGVRDRGRDRRLEHARAAGSRGAGRGRGTAARRCTSRSDRRDRRRGRQSRRGRQARSRDRRAREGKALVSGSRRLRVRRRQALLPRSWWTTASRAFATRSRTIRATARIES